MDSSNFSMLVRKELFKEKNYINLTVRSLFGYAKLGPCNTAISLWLGKGSIDFENIEFIGNGDLNSQYNFERIWGASSSFLIISGDGNTSVRFNNCRFEWIFLHIPSGIVYGSLIYIENKLRKSDRIIIYEIILNNTIFNRTIFPNGIVNSKSLDNDTIPDKHIKKILKVNF